MQKRYTLSTLLSILSINLVSAAYYSGGYEGFSLSDLLDSIEPSTMILGAIFILSFIFINFSLAKFFKETPINASIASFVISLLITWGISRTGYDFEELFYDFGMSADFLMIAVPIILLIGTSLFYIRRRRS